MVSRYVSNFTLGIGPNHSGHPPPHVAPMPLGVAMAATAAAAAAAAAVPPPQSQSAAAAVAAAAAAVQQQQQQQGGPQQSQGNQHGQQGQQSQATGQLLKGPPNPHSQQPPPPPPEYHVPQCLMQGPSGPPPQAQHQHYRILHSRSDGYVASASAGGSHQGASAVLRGIQSSAAPPTAPQQDLNKMQQPQSMQFVAAVTSNTTGNLRAGQQSNVYASTRTTGGNAGTAIPTVVPGQRSGPRHSSNLMQQVYTQMIPQPAFSVPYGTPSFQARQTPSIFSNTFYPQQQLQYPYYQSSFFPNPSLIPHRPNSVSANMVASPNSQTITGAPTQAQLTLTTGTVINSGQIGGGPGGQTSAGVAGGGTGAGSGTSTSGSRKKRSHAVEIINPKTNKNVLEEMERSQAVSNSEVDYHDHQMNSTSGGGGGGSSNNAEILANSNTTVVVSQSQQDQLGIGNTGTGGGGGGSSIDSSSCNSKILSQGGVTYGDILSQQHKMQMAGSNIMGSSHQVVNQVMNDMIGSMTPIVSAMSDAPSVEIHPKQQQTKTKKNKYSESNNQQHQQQHQHQHQQQQQHQHQQHEQQIEKLDSKNVENTDKLESTATISCESNEEDKVIDVSRGKSNLQDNSQHSSSSSSSSTQISKDNFTSSSLQQQQSSSSLESNTISISNQGGGISSSDHKTTSDQQRKQQPQHHNNNKQGQFSAKQEEEQQQKQSIEQHHHSSNQQRQKSLPPAGSSTSAGGLSTVGKLDNLNPNSSSSIQSSSSISSLSSSNSTSSYHSQGGAAGGNINTSTSSNVSSNTGGNTNLSKSNKMKEKPHQQQQPNSHNHNNNQQSSDQQQHHHHPQQQQQHHYNQHQQQQHYHHPHHHQQQQQQQQPQHHHNQQDQLPHDHKQQHQQQYNKQQQNNERMKISEKENKNVSSTAITATNGNSLSSSSTATLNRNNFSSSLDNTAASANTSNTKTNYNNNNNNNNSNKNNNNNISTSNKKFSGDKNDNTIPNKNNLSDETTAKKTIDNSEKISSRDEPDRVVVSSKSSIVSDTGSKTSATVVDEENKNHNKNNTVSSSSSSSGKPSELLAKINNSNNNNNNERNLPPKSSETSNVMNTLPASSSSSSIGASSLSSSKDSNNGLAESNKNNKKQHQEQRFRNDAKTSSNDTATEASSSPIAADVNANDPKITTADINCNINSSSSSSSGNANNNINTSSNNTSNKNNINSNRDDKTSSSCADNGNKTKISSSNAGSVIDNNTTKSATTVAAAASKMIPENSSSVKSAPSPSDATVPASGDINNSTANINIACGSTSAVPSIPSMNAPSQQSQKSSTVVAAPSSSSSQSTNPKTILIKYDKSAMDKNGKFVYNKQKLLAIRERDLSRRKPNISTEIAANLMPDNNSIRSPPSSVIPHFLNKMKRGPSIGGSGGSNSNLLGGSGNLLLACGMGGNSGSNSGGGGGGYLKQSSMSVINAKNSSKGSRSGIIHLSLSLREDVKLNESENAWKPAHLLNMMNSSGSGGGGNNANGGGGSDGHHQNDQMKEDPLHRQVRGILNKLTPENFETLTEQILNLPMDHSPETTEGVMKLVFEKAVDEPNFSASYAKLCERLAERGQHSKDFRVKLLDKTQHEFLHNVIEREKTKELQAIEQQINECNDPEKELELRASYAEEERKIRRRSAGTVRFIGELFKINMLTGKIIITCIQQLLDPDSEDKLECLCKLLTTTGDKLENSKQHHSLETYFNKMRNIVERKMNTKVSSRVRFMLQDVIDLRKNKWISTKQDLNPKTMEQIQKEVKTEQINNQYMAYNNNLSNKMMKDDRRFGSSNTGINSCNSNINNSSSVSYTGSGGSGGGGGGGYYNKNNRQSQNNEESDWITKTSKGRFDRNKLNSIGIRDIDSERTFGCAQQFMNWPVGASSSTSNTTKTSNSYAVLSNLESSNKNTLGGGTKNKSGSYNKGSIERDRHDGVHSRTGSAHGSRENSSSRNAPQRGSNSNVQKLNSYQNYNTNTIKSSSSSMPPSSSSSFTLSTTGGSSSGIIGGEATGGGRSGISNSSAGTAGSSINVVGGSSMMKTTSTDKLQSSTVPPRVIYDDAKDYEDKIMSALGEMVEEAAEGMDQCANILQNFPSGVHWAFFYHIFCDYLHKGKVDATHRKLLADTVLYLLKKNFVSVEHIKNGYEGFCDMVEDIMIDVPKIWIYVFEFFGPFLHKNIINIQDIWNETLKKANAGEKFLTEYLLCCIREVGPGYTRKMWKENKLKWTDFIDKENVENFKRTNKFEFIDSKEEIKVNFNSNKDINKVMDRVKDLLDSKDSYSAVTDYISGNISDINKVFIRAFTTTLCRYAIKNTKSTYKLDKDDFVTKCIPLLNVYIDSVEEYKLECLYAIQLLINQLEHPQGLLSELFYELYNEDVIGNDVFVEWHDSDKELPGKGVAVKGLTCFFKLLDDEGDDN